MKKLLLAIMAMLLFGLFSFSSARDNNAIASVNADGTFSVNTEIAKKKVIHGLPNFIKDFQIDAIEVQAAIPVGDKHEKVYYMVFTDNKKNIKLSKSLVLVKGNLYYYEDVKGKKPADDNVFYESYYSIIGSKADDCYPNIAYTDKELYWITGDKLACDINSPCKSQQHITIAE